MAGEQWQGPDPARRRLYAREDALLKRLQSGEDTPEVRAELAAVRAAIRRSLRHESGRDDEQRAGEQQE